MNLPAANPESIGELIARLSALHPKRIDLGLERMQRLLKRLDHPERVLPPVIHVAGTNGKGSTIAYLRAILEAAGLRVHVYTSPYLVRINESIEASRDLLGNALEAYLSAVSQRTNEIVKYLTIMSAVFLPLAFVVGFFGQNFVDFPFVKDWIHSDRLMWAMVATCVVLPVGMIAWFRHKHWV